MQPSLRFLCVANPARSQMAEGLARACSAGRFVCRAPAASRARATRTRSPPLREVGIDITGQRSRAVDEIRSRAAPRPARDAELIQRNDSRACSRAVSRKARNAGDTLER
jgi:hypothetical protein